MFGVMLGIVVSVGTAAGLLATLARRHAPADGWREILRSGVHAARAKELTYVDHVRGAQAGGLGDLFTVAEPVQFPAYTEVTDLQRALTRLRALARR
jgi:hypothetical protein